MQGYLVGILLEFKLIVNNLGEIEKNNDSTADKKQVEKGMGHFKKIHFL